LAVNQKKGSFRYRIAEYLVFKKIRKQLGGHLRIAVSGGASLNEKIAKFFWKIGVKILEGYGLTETSPVISVNSEEGYKFGTVGRHVSGVKVKISSEKEILVKGPNVMQAYYKNPEETKKAFDEEGWFCTGDLGFVDNEGFLTVVGRKKEMIVTSYGKNVWPEKIENEANKDSYVAQAMVIGHNRKFIAALIVPDWGEVKNFLIKNNLQVQDPERLVTSQKIVDLLQERINLINQNLSSYEQIKKFKLLDEEFSSAKEELTPTLKLRRHIIEKHYQKEIEGMYS
jgi:long-chain acyl-CoA synthetase